MLNENEVLKASSQSEAKKSCTVIEVVEDTFDRHGSGFR